MSTIAAISPLFTTKSKLFTALFKSQAGQLDRVGDHYVGDRLKRMSSREIPEPLLLLDGPPDSYKSIVTLTDRGSDVLAGRANFVELNGMDGWVGGMHLQSSAGRVWFRRDDSLVSAS